MKSSTLGPVFLAALTLGLTTKSLGKQDLKKQLLPSLETGNRFVEPFVSGGKCPAAMRLQAARILPNRQQTYNTSLVQQVKA